MRRGGVLGSMITLGAVLWGASMFMRSRNRRPVNMARHLLSRSMNMMDMTKLARMSRRFARNFAR